MTPRCVGHPMKPMSPTDPRSATLALLSARSGEATICPSEVARAMTTSDTGVDWRCAMPAVHAAVDEMMHQGLVTISWKGRPLATRAGPYRLHRGPKAPE